jgi:hypothetical protein
MPAPDLFRAQWFKSSYSGTEANCVEAAYFPGMTAIRDSKDAGGPVVTLTPEAWATFIADVKAAGLPRV